MGRRYFFVDEAGNFDFSDRQGASRYFILTSVLMDDNDCRIADSLLELRRELVWEGHPLIDAFHATSDKQAVRDRVFELISGMRIRIDATIFDKRQIAPERRNPSQFYSDAWYGHARELIPACCDGGDDLLVVSASIGTRKEQVLIGRAVTEVVNQSGRSRSNTRVSYWPALSDPCLQVADYCCWAIQRKWERSDARSYVLIEKLIATEKTSPGPVQGRSLDRAGEPAISPLGEKRSQTSCHRPVSTFIVSLPVLTVKKE
jgi:hypothetical protein